MENKFQKNSLLKDRFFLSNRCFQTILGGLLGDGSLKIQTGFANARFQIRHSLAQKEYFDWKVKNLEEISTKKAVHLQKADGFSNKKKLHYQSKALSILTKINSIVYNNNTSLNIDKSWLIGLDKLGLLIWWLDDGSLVVNGRQGCISTNSFSKRDQDTLIDYMDTVWNVKAVSGRMSASTKKSNQLTDVNESFESKNLSDFYRLYLNNTELRKFFALIMPSLETKSMLKKFAFRYNDLKYQKRWISIMKEAIPQFHNEIDELYSDQNLFNKDKDFESTVAVGLAKSEIEEFYSNL